MAAATRSHDSCSSVLNDNFKVISSIDSSYCELLIMELLTLHNAVKSLTEIINMLNIELKLTYSTELTKMDMKSAGTVESLLFACDNCMQLEAKLVKAQEEINSQKLIINILKKEHTSGNQLQHDNLKIVNLSTTDREIIHPQWTKKTLNLHNAAVSVQYKIPTSNRYASLDIIPEQMSGSSLLAPQRDVLSNKSPPRMIKNPKLKMKSRPIFQNKVNPASLGIHKNLQAHVPDQEFCKIPKIVNGVIESPDYKKFDS